MTDAPTEVLRELLHAADLHGCREFACFTIDPPGGELSLFHHHRGPGVDESMRDATEMLFRDLIGDCIARSRNGVTCVSPADAPGLPLFCLVVLSPEQTFPYAAAGFMLNCRDDRHAAQALKSLCAEMPLFGEGRSLL